MKTHLECIPCFMKQSLEAAQMATQDETIQTDVLKAVMTYLKSTSFTQSPPELSREIHYIIRKLTNSKDPYIHIKNTSNNMAKNLYPQLKKMVNNSNDPLLMAVKLAIVGNVIDFGTTTRFDINDMLTDIDNKDIDADAYPNFKTILSRSTTILYLADNTGEIFFDKILIEELLKQHKKVIYTVRSNPIINDATKKDAIYAELDKITQVIEGDNGQQKSAPGFVPDFCSTRLHDLIITSDMILSKGQGNYEGLNELNREIIFLLVVKCPLVAREINSEVGKLILKVKS